MMLASKSSVEYDLENQSTLLFEENEIPLTVDEWLKLAELLAESDYQHIVSGDANENHSVWVSRYHNDVSAPVALNEQSDAIKAIVMSPKMRAFYKCFTGTEELCLRRCQANRLQTGDYIGWHKDQDSSPEYLATIVFHFGEQYTGGVFQTGDDEETLRSYRPDARMALVNSCSIPHQVSMVESGERLTLACFLSTSFAANKKSRYAFRTDHKKLKK
jgi:hypothetical protein